MDEPQAPAAGDVPAIASLVACRRVLVTGAGGTIGSELCRQLLGGNPESLVMLDQHEGSLFAVHASMTRALDERRSAQALETRLRCVVADVADAPRLKAVLRDEAPSVVFHAAAYKHVPLMEAHPCEAIKNNVRGTRILIEASVLAGVSQVITISSDKAVNPTSVMGATKTLTEAMTRSFGAATGTRCAAVRFGNVLGSSGSVLEVFLRQLRQGGPLTVTHPDAHRYFMLLPDAVQLLLQVVRVDDGGGWVYGLDPGTPVRVEDLARLLIEAAVDRGQREVSIVYTGLRAGEKLSEEWLGAGETTSRTDVEGILRIHPPAEVPDAAALRAAVSDLERAALTGETALALALLRQMTPSRTE